MLISVFGFLLSASTLLSQNEMRFSISEVTEGKNLLTNQDVISKEYVFPQKIYHVFTDTIGQNLTIQLRNLRKNNKNYKNVGHIALFNPGEQAVKWSKRIDFRHSAFRQYDQTIFETTNASSIGLLNIENGNTGWKIKNTLYYVDPELNIGIGYGYSSFSGWTNKLQGIDLTTGNILWERELMHEYGWNDVFALNDSTLVIASSGLHAFDINTGKGWSYFMNTGEKDYTGMIAANAAGLALGLLTGSFIVTTGADLVREVVSNIVIDSSNIYFAAMDKIVCLNHWGEAKWSVPLHKDMASKSTIYEEDGRIYMINHGFAFMGYRKINYGIPFIAAFDAQTGNQIFLNTIEGKKEQIKGFKLNGDTIIMLSNNGFSRYSLKDGLLACKKDMDEILGEPLYFIGSHVYIQTDSTFNSLPLSNLEAYFVYTSQDKLTILNADFDPIGEVPETELFIYYMWYNGYRFISREDQTLILDEAGRAVAEIPGSNESFILDSKFYSIRDNSLLETPLDDLVGN